jgi:hypothetical protein
MGAPAGISRTVERHHIAEPADANWFTLVGCALAAGRAAGGAETTRLC